MLDRTISPPYRKLDKFEIKRVETEYLRNGIAVHSLRSGQQPVLRIEIVIPAGSWHELSAGAAYFTTKMLGEGTRLHSAKQIEDTIAQFGAFLDLNPGNDRVTITLYTLEKYFSRLLPVIHEILTQPAFGGKELENLKNITKQNLRVNQEKTSYLAGIKFRQMMFGHDHPYGRSLNEELIQDIRSENLTSHYSNFLLNQKTDIILAGSVPADAASQLEQLFGSRDISGNAIEPNNPKALFKAGKSIIEKKESLQSSIRLGIPLFTIQHPDYFKIHLLIEILGGYFGSRLMKNIREDKGYTYGIYASFVSFANEGYMVVGTDVKKEFTKDTIREIYKEIDLLKSKPVEEDELETVKSYLSGTFLSSINSPFALADKFKTIYFNGLGYSFYDDYLLALQTISSKDILETANKYFSSPFVEVIAGGEE